MMKKIYYYVTLPIRFIVVNVVEEMISILTSFNDVLTTIMVGGLVIISLLDAALSD